MFLYFKNNISFLIFYSLFSNKITIFHIKKTFSFIFKLSLYFIFEKTCFYYLIFVKKCILYLLSKIHVFIFISFLLFLKMFYFYYFRVVLKPFSLFFFVLKIYIWYFSRNINLLIFRKHLVRSSKIGKYFIIYYYYYYYYYLFILNQRDKGWTSGYHNNHQTKQPHVCDSYVTQNK